MVKLSSFIAVIGVATTLTFQACGQTGNRDNSESVKRETEERARNTGQDIKQGAEKAADKTAEIAVKGAAAITDQVHRDKEGPNGETIYIDEHANFYWVNDQGKKVYIAEDRLRNKK